MHHLNLFEFNLIKFILKYFEELVSGIFLSITVLVVVLNVILRYIFNTGLIWVSEVSTACFVWAVFVGAAAAYKHKMHIGIDLFLKIFPDKFQLLINLIIDLFMIFISGYISYLSIIFIQNSYKKITPILGISSAYISFSLSVGFSLICFYSIKFFIKDSKIFLESYKK